MSSLGRGQFSGWILLPDRWVRVTTADTFEAAYAATDRALAELLAQGFAFCGRWVCQADEGPGSGGLLDLYGGPCFAPRPEPPNPLNN